MSGGAPARERRSSPRHRGPPGRETAYCRTRRSAGTAWSAGLRPASRGSAKPALMTLRPANVSGTPPLAVKMQLRRAPTGQSGAQARERRPPVGTRGSAKPALMTLRPAPVSATPPLAVKMQLRRAPTGQSGAQARERRPPVGTRGSAKPAPMTLTPCRRECHTTSCCENAVAPGPHRAERRAGQGTPTSGRHRAGARNQP